MTKYPKFQDYVIKNGKLIGEFEQMYKDFEDPWNQSINNERNSSHKLLALDWIKELYKDKKDLKVIDVGCGFGFFVNQLNKNKIQTLGVDISETAIKNAKKKFPNCDFVVGDLLDFGIYKKFCPDVMVMSEITWYVLDKLDYFIQYLKKNFPDIYLIHLLVTYTRGVQKYGTNHFTDFDGILKYFDMDILETNVFADNAEGGKRTIFIGKFKK